MERSMRAWGLASWAAAATLVSGAAAQAQDAANADAAARAAAAPLCVVRKLDPAMSSGTDSQDLTAWVTVMQPMYAYVTATGTAKGGELGRVALRVLRDGTLLAGSGDVTGSGLIDVSVRGGAYLVPGRQYRFVVKPELRGASMVALRMAVGGMGCG